MTIGELTIVPPNDCLQLISRVLYLIMKVSSTPSVPSTRSSELYIVSDHSSSPLDPDVLDLC